NSELFLVERGLSGKSEFPYSSPLTASCIITGPSPSPRHGQSSIRQILESRVKEGANCDE
ncbi:hypothetical protein NY536_21895, partial [Enterobacter hormaechei]|nr:hypothetical protein [Enterobacter hormaechei]